MKNKFFFALLVLATTFQVASFEDDESNTGYRKYFNNIVAGTAFDMSKDEFRSVLEKRNIEYSLSSFERTFFLENLGKAFDKAAFTFSPDVNPAVSGFVLHNVELSFSNKESALAFLTDNFGEATLVDGKMEWQNYNYEDYYQAKAQQIDNKIVFFAALANVRLNVNLQQSKHTFLELEELWNEQVAIVVETLEQISDPSDEGMRFTQTRMQELKPITKKIYDFDDGLYFLTENITKAIEAAEACESVKQALLAHEKSLDKVYKASANLYEKVDILIEAESDLAVKFDEMIDAINVLSTDANKFNEWYDTEMPDLPACHEK